jgi:hypothetical protein
MQRTLKKLKQLVAEYYEYPQTTGHSTEKIVNVTNFDLDEKTRILRTVGNAFPKLLRLGPHASLINYIQRSLSALIPVLKLIVIRLIMI